MLFTHGIYGSGANWRGIARKVVDRTPTWGALLVDLRGHGRSPTGDPPHTVDACAEDLAALVAQYPVRAAVGHSFGGKVVLALRARAEIEEVWVLDATPSARPAAFDAPDNTVRQVLELMERLPARFAKRDDFVAAVIAAGQTETLARWLAMNLVPDGDAMRLRLDLPMIRALLADYFTRDLWDAVPGTRFVLGARSTTVPPEDRARLEAAGARVDVVDGGHWLHLDAPAALVELLAR